MTVPDKRPAFESAEKLLQLPERDPGMQRPISITAGAALVLLRVLTGAVVLIQLAFVPTSDLNLIINDTALTDDAKQLGLVFVLSAGALVLLFDLVLTVLIYRGHNVARVFMMIISTMSISASFAGWWWAGQDVTLQTSLATVAVDILILLALSSRDSAAYARRFELDFSKDRDAAASRSR